LFNILATNTSIPQVGLRMQISNILCNDDTCVIWIILVLYW